MLGLGHRDCGPSVNRQMMGHRNRGYPATLGSECTEEWGGGTPKSWAHEVTALAAREP